MHLFLGIDAGGTSTRACVADLDGVGVADGLGWLLGDEGSGFWLGREALRATLENLRHRESRISPLASAVAAQLLDGRTLVGERLPRLIAAAYDAPPLALSAL